jgi:hypothetical protein
MIDVFCSKQLDLLLLVDSPVGSMQIDTYVTRSNQTQTSNPGLRKAAFRQQPVTLRCRPARSHPLDVIFTLDPPADASTPDA